MQQQQLRTKYFNDRLKQVQKHFQAAFEELLSEPYLFDDSNRHEIGMFLQYIVTGTETLIFQFDGEMVGMAIFTNVTPGRHADFNGWIAPQFRQAGEFRKLIYGTMMDEVTDLAWNHLKLIRMEARIAEVNQPALGFAQQIGFKKVGTLQLDLQFFGQLFDSVLLEIVNPAYEIAPLTEKEQHGIRQERRVSESEPDGPVHDDDDDAGDESEPTGNSTAT